MTLRSLVPDHWKAVFYWASVVRAQVVDGIIIHRRTRIDVDNVEADTPSQSRGDGLFIRSNPIDPVSLQAFDADDVTKLFLAEYVTDDENLDVRFLPDDRQYLARCAGKLRDGRLFYIRVSHDEKLNLEVKVASGEQIYLRTIIPKEIRRRVVKGMKSKSKEPKT